MLLELIYGTNQSLTLPYLKLLLTKGHSMYDFYQQTTTLPRKILANGEYCLIRSRASWSLRMRWGRVSNTFEND